MRTLVPAVFLAVILAFLAPALPAALKKRFRRRPALLFAVPLTLSAVFCVVAWRSGVLSLPLVLLIGGYTLLPTVCIFIQGADAGPATWVDLIAILMLWLPVELNAGGNWIPRQAQRRIRDTQRHARNRIPCRCTTDLLW